MLYICDSENMSLKDAITLSYTARLAIKTALIAIVRDEKISLRTIECDT